MSGIAVLIRRLQAKPGSSSDVEVLGRCERGALTTSIALGQAMGLAVTAIAVGPARREDRVLAVALRMGCQRAIRISDDGLDELDYLGIGQVLAAAVRWAGATIVICGDRSEEEGTGAIGPAVAELLNAAHVTAVARVQSDGETLLVERAADAQRQRLRVIAPVVLCVQPPEVGARGPRDFAAEEEERSRPKGRALTPAPVASIEALDVAKIGLDARALAHRRAAAGRMRAVRGPRRAALATSPLDLIARLRADHLVGDPDRGPDRGGGEPT